MREAPSVCDLAAAPTPGPPERVGLIRLRRIDVDVTATVRTLVGDGRVMAFAIRELGRPAAAGGDGKHGALAVIHVPEAERMANFMEDHLGWDVSAAEGLQRRVRIWSRDDGRRRRDGTKGVPFDCPPHVAADSRLKDTSHGRTRDARTGGSSGGRHSNRIVPRRHGADLRTHRSVHRLTGL